jgi:hypothetical protein
MAKMQKKLKEDEMKVTQTEGLGSRGLGVREAQGGRDEGDAD